MRCLLLMLPSLVLPGCKDADQKEPSSTVQVPEFEDVNGTGISVAAYDMSKTIEDENGVKLLSNRLDVRFIEGASDAEVLEALSSINGAIIAKNEPLRYYSVEIPETDVDGIRNALWITEDNICLLNFP